MIAVVRDVPETAEAYCHGRGVIHRDTARKLTLEAFATICAVSDFLVLFRVFFSPLSLSCAFFSLYLFAFALNSLSLFLIIVRI